MSDGALLRSVLTLLVLLLPTWCLAHDPHDVIDAVLDVPGDASRPDRVYVIRSYDFLLRSADGGGSWQELNDGLDIRHQLTDIAAAGSGAGEVHLILTTDGDGVYFSRDGGDSWSRSRRGPEAARIAAVKAFLVGGQMVAFAAGTTGGLFRSNDGGATWDRVLSDDHQITAFGFWEQNPDFQVIAAESSGSIEVSGNAGESWMAMAGPVDAGAVTTVLPPGNAGGAALLGTEHGGVFRWQPASGQPFGAASAGLSDRRIRDLARMPGSGLLLVSTWKDGIYTSADDAESWSLAAQGLTRSSQADSGVFYSPHFREMAIAQGGSAEPSIYLAGFNGLFVSRDLARSWTQLETAPVAQILGLTVSPATGDDYLVALSTYGAGIYMRPSTGGAWDIETLGLVRPRSGKVAFSPHFSDDGLIFALQDEGDHLLRRRSTDDAWTPVELAPDWMTLLKGKVLGKLRYWGVPARFTTDLLSRRELIRVAQPKVIAFGNGEPPTLFVGTRWRGIYRSTDGGKTVSQIDDGPKEAWEIVRAASGPKAVTLVASAREQGVFRSRDSGRSWVPAERGLEFLKQWRSPGPNPERHAFELGRSKTFNLHLLAPSSAPGTVFLYGGPGVFRSDDAGLSWMNTTPPSLGRSPMVLAAAVSPDFAHDRVLVVSVKGRGLWISHDRGRSFQPFAVDLRHANHEVRNIAFSPFYPGDSTVYAASRQSLFESTDGGATWWRQPRPARYESDRLDVVPWHGEWSAVEGSQYSSSRAIRLTEGSLTFPFVGTGVRVIGSEAVGEADMRVDGRAAAPRQVGQAPGLAETSVTISGLGFGAHVMTLHSPPGGIVVDALDVLDGRPPERVR